MNARCPVRLHKIVCRLLAIGLLGLVLYGTSLHGAATKPSEVVDAHVFFHQEDGNMLPIVGAKSNDKVIVKSSVGETKVVRADGAAFQVKQLPPAGRVTILSTDGEARSDTLYYTDYLSRTSGSRVNMSMVSDSNLEDVYVALLLTPPEEGAGDIVTFCPIGELRAGEISRKGIVLPSIMLANWRYRFEIYCNGFPVEMFRLDEVADVSGSQGLLIPWEMRIAFFLSKARELERSAKPRPFDIGFTHLDLAGCRERDLAKLEIRLKIHRDGSAEIVEADANLTRQEAEQLRADVQSWHFFPALDNGKPVEFEVKLPVQLS